MTGTNVSLLLLDWDLPVNVRYPVKAALFICTTVINIQKVPAELIPDFPVSGCDGKIGR